MQPLTIKVPGCLAIADTVIAWTVFGGIMIDPIALHSTSTPDVLEGVSYDIGGSDKSTCISDTL